MTWAYRQHNIYDRLIHILPCSSCGLLSIPANLEIWKTDSITAGGPGTSLCNSALMMSVDQIRGYATGPLYHSVVNNEISQAVSEVFRLSFTPKSSKKPRCSNIRMRFIFTYLQKTPCDILFFKMSIFSNQNDCQTKALPLTR